MEISTHIERFTEYLITLPGVALLIFFGFSNFLENIFPPWPGDTFTVFSGFIASQPEAPFTVFSLFFATLLGNWAGALLMFHFGKKGMVFLRHSEHRLIRSNYSEEAFLKTMSRFRTYSGLLIILSRFSAGIRFFVAIVAGMSKMNWVLFLFYYTVSIVIWCGLLLTAGFKLGRNWEQINVMLATYNQTITTILIFLCLSGGFYYFYRKKEQS